ncbi:hypothetical protein D1F64_03705 [Breoghania sp. L-A4]|nr:hypothetical protein D1F64_03705 [Breoghania sp. L-A4]
MLFLIGIFGSTVASAQNVSRRADASGNARETMSASDGPGAGTPNVAENATRLQDGGATRRQEAASGLYSPANLPEMTAISDLDKAHGLVALGDALADLGLKSPALLSHINAYKILLRLTAADQRNVALEYDLLMVLETIVYAMPNGRYAAAHAKLSYGLFQGASHLDRIAPAHDGYERGLSAYYFSMGSWAQALGQAEHALIDYDSTHDILRDLLAARPHDTLLGKRMASVQGRIDGLLAPNDTGHWWDGTPGGFGAGPALDAATRAVLTHLTKLKSQLYLDSVNARRRSPRTPLSPVATGAGLAIVSDDDSATRALFGDLPTLGSEPQRPTPYEATLKAPDDPYAAMMDSMAVAMGSGAGRTTVGGARPANADTLRALIDPRRDEGPHGPHLAPVATGGGLAILSDNDPATRALVENLPAPRNTAQKPISSTPSPQASDNPYDAILDDVASAMKAGMGRSVVRAEEQTTPDLAK